MKRWMILLAAAVSLAAGIGFPALNARKIVPSLRGNVYSMLSLEQGTFMVLSEGENNCLVRLDGEGALLNFCRTGRNEAFQYLEAEGETVYAIQNTYRNRSTQQTLVSLSLAQTAMNPKALCVLPGEGSITWMELYLPVEGVEEDLLLVGVDMSKQAWLLRYDLQSGETAREEILPGAEIYQLKYVEPGRYLYIDGEGRLGQYDNGGWMRDILDGLAETPMHISTCGTRCFVSDSRTGDIYEVSRGGAASLYREGGASLDAAGFTYGDIRLFTTRNRDGEIHVVGLCLNESGAIALEEGTPPIRKIQVGWKAAALLFGRDILLWTGGSFASLLLLLLLVRQIVASRRVVVRLILCTTVVVVLLLAGIVEAQRDTYLETLEEEALEKFKLVGANLIETLSTREAGVPWPEWNAPYAREVAGHVREQYEQLQSRVTEGTLDRGMKNLNISILYYEDGAPYIYYDRTIPWGYEAADMKRREYIQGLEDARDTGTGTAVTVKTDVLDELLYAVAFQDGQTGRRGCVTIEQPLADVTSAVSELDRTLLVYAVVGPFLLAALILIFWRFLRPLKEIKAAMDQFYESGSGNQIFLRDGAAKDEFYDISRTFNKLSMETRVQMNQLSTINGAYARFVPDCMLKALGRNNVQEVQPGDSVQVEGGILIAAPRGREHPGLEPDRYLPLWAGEIARCGGIITDYDEGTGAVTAVFLSGPGDPPGRGGPETALRCGESCIGALRREKLDGMLLAHGTRLLFGVWGTKDMLLPMAVSEELHRLVSALPVLLLFGCTMVVGGTAAEGREDLRLLGSLSGEPPLPLWEAFAFGEAGLELRRRRTLSAFQDAVRLFEERRFYESEALFAKVLREDPEDSAAKWYLFRCEELARADKNGRADTGISG